MLFSQLERWSGQESQYDVLVVFGRLGEIETLRNLDHDALDLVRHSDLQAWLAAVTGPRNAFPAWEGSEPFFKSTRDRFHDAGLNGGIYELWKWLEDDPRLPEGRYYTSISWSSEREASATLQVFAVLYPGRGDEDLWVRDEPQGLVLNPGGRDPSNPTDLEI